VFKGKPSISKPISSLLTLRKSGWPFFVFQHHCILRPYSAARPKNIIEHEKCTEQKHNRCFNATIQHPVLVQPRNLAYQKAILQNLNSSRTVKPYWKFQTKAYQITLLKNNTKIVLFIQSFYQSLIKKTNHHVKQNQSNKRNLWRSP
jgi:hypothetical protein